MPTYEFHCKECGYYFEFFASISEKERKAKEHSIACEQCGSNKVEQVFGGFSILTGTQVRQNTGGGSGCCGGGACC
ncbi:MAG: zinc ribbon domain-containing protein [Ignavibacteriales bacterium CG07_land_8_20_14_0_80_59_12]|jgi:putative FmdB family regulatory protein|nr:MAG: zinc ribbon domain-containing protein [Ignavibacteriales bacterium CG07_land_8_20_14_0_80_59_12]